MALIKFIFSFLSAREKKMFLGLMLLMILLALLELAGFSSIFSYITLLTDPELIQRNRLLARIYSGLHFTSQRHFFLFLGSGVFVVLVVRGLVSAANLYFQSLFTAHLRNRLSMELLGGYVRMPYVEFLSVNTAVLTKHLLEEVSNVVSSISTFLNLLTESIVSLTLVLLLLVVDPVLVLLVSLSISLLTFGIISTTRKRISAIGRESELCSRKMFKSTYEILGGFKDIKVCHSEGYFMSKFESALTIGSRLGVRLKMIAGLPGMILNLGAFALLLLTLLYLLASRGSIASALPVISLLALTVQKFLPSADKIFNSIGMIKKYAPGVEIISSALRQSKRGSSSAAAGRHRFSFDKSIALEHIDFLYPGAHRKALCDISLRIGKNSSLGIIGSSGAGKSTFVDVLLGLLPVSSGRIVCDAKVLEEANLNDFHSIVGYVPQQTFLLDDTIAVNIAFGAEVDAQRMEKAVRIAQLTEFIASLPLGLQTEIGDKGVRISGGQRQRIGIARALYREPTILILDEATNSLDSVTENSFNESLKNLMGKMTMIIVAHRYTTLKYCDAVIVMKEGRIEASGSLDELSAKSAEFRTLYATFAKGELL